MLVLKTTVSVTPELGLVLTGQSCFHDHVCIENDSKYQTLIIRYVEIKLLALQLSKKVY